MADAKQTKGLTPRQARFVSEYVIDLNATQAAIRAGYSAKTAEVQGCRLLRNVQVRAAVSVKQDRVTKKLDFTLEGQLAKLEEVRKAALEGGQYGATVSAVQAQNKMLGLDAPTKLDVNATVKTDEATDAEKARMIVAALAKASNEADARQLH
jgi:phage terminase small subunit